MELYFYPILLLVAFLYASVGHGGASGYIALLVFFNFPHSEIKTDALILNVFVSAIAFLSFYNKKEFQWKLILLLMLCSVPMAFLGGLLDVDSRIYKIILGIFLIFPILRLLKLIPTTNKNIPVTFFTIALLGLSIGFFSGLIGIGGGIILTPCLLILGWCSIKEAAAMSAIFIFMNSCAGLIGTSIHGLNYSPTISWIILTALTGGILGGYFGKKKFNSDVLKKILAFVLTIACFKLWLT